jgi:hypothetical protein
VYQAVRLPPLAERQPAWATALAPLTDAPIPAHAAVALLALERVTRSASDATAVLYEAVWRRPDLHWAYLSRWPAGVPPRFAVALGDAPVPVGWRVTWRQGVVAVLERAGP